jgi:gamma-glutamylcyclotransferase (GGCT)/AIG2-like uncharacterized protein YtfP
MKNCLFVYGTLRLGSGHPMARYLRASAIFIGQGWMPGKKINLGDYPAAIYDEAAEEKVDGDVFHLTEPEKTLATLDLYEGIGEEFPHPQEYVRLEKTVFLNATPCVCWVYLLNPAWKASSRFITP